MPSQFFEYQPYRYYTLPLPPTHNRFYPHIYFARDYPLYSKFSVFSSYVLYILPLSVLKRGSYGTIIRVQSRVYPSGFCVKRKSMDGYHPQGLLSHKSYVEYVTLAHTEGYPSGLRGWFAKSLVWGDLEREFESPLLRHIKEMTERSSFCLTVLGIR